LEVNRSVQLGFQSGEESGKEFIAEIMDDTSTIGWYDFETKYEQSLIESPTNIAGRRFNSWSAVNGNSEDGGGCELIQEFVIQYDKLLEHEDNNTSKFVECAQEERRSRMMDAVDDVMRAG